MNLQQAEQLKEDFEYLVGEELDELEIDELIIAPVNADEFKNFISDYSGTQDAELALEPYSGNANFTVIAVFENNVSENLLSVVRKLNIEIDYEKYGIK